MPTIPIHVLQQQIPMEDLQEEFAKLQKQLRYLLNGQIDFENIRARSIKSDNIEAGAITTNELAANSVSTDKLAAGAVTADKIEAGAVTAEKIDVNQLSAIAADLGTITAGLLQAVQIIGSTITGSLIQTSESSYPRAEMRSDLQMFIAESVAGKLAQIAAGTGTPILLFSDGSDSANISVSPGLIGSGNRLSINSSVGVEIRVPFVDFITSFGQVSFTDWNVIYNRDNTRTLQQDLDAKGSASAVSDLFSLYASLDARVTALENA